MTEVTDKMVYAAMNAYGYFDERRMRAAIEATLAAREQEDDRAKDRDHRDRVANILDKNYPKVAAKVRAGMRSSTWPEDLVDPGLLIDLLEHGIKP